MSGLEKILKSIDDDAEILAKKIIDDAKKEVDKILKEARLKATKEMLDIIDKSEVSSLEIVKRAKAQAEIEKKSKILKVKNELIDSIINQTKEYLLELSDKEYFDIIFKIFEKQTIKEKGELVFSKKDLERIPRGFKTAVSKFSKEKGAEIKVSADTRNISGGFVLVCGNIEENCSFDALFNSHYETIKDKVNKALFS
ncbi:MAG: V-type proton ATPase subunit E [Eubacteriales bacterium SKADARSKE-1]|nr:V-type proton ATPase subunit E [Eubacteriales bacterium SKADARSKE-1]